MSKYGMGWQNNYYSIRLQSTGASPLHDAARTKNIKLIKILSQDVMNLKALDYNGRSALHYAAIAGFEEGYNLLKDKGASAELEDNFGYTPAKLLEISPLGDVDDASSCAIL